MGMAGIPMRSQPENRSAMRAAPSSIEYSECTCRWTNEPSPGCVLPGIPAPTSISNRAARALPDTSGEAQQAPTLVARSPHTSLRRASDSAGGTGSIGARSRGRPESLVPAPRQHLLDSPDVADRRAHANDVAEPLRQLAPSEAVGVVHINLLAGEGERFIICGDCSDLVLSVPCRHLRQEGDGHLARVAVRIRVLSQDLLQLR